MLFFLLNLKFQSNSNIYTTMKKSTLFATLAFSLVLAGTVKAQFDYVKPDDLDQFHERTLVVVVEKPSDAVKEKLGKKHKTDGDNAYSAAIDSLNKHFADAITQYWKVSGGEVEYKTLDEVNDISDKKGYAVLFCRSVSQADLSTAYTEKNGIMWWPDFKEVIHDKDFSDKMTVVGMCLLEKLNKTPMYQFAMPDIFPTKEDFLYAINAANSYLNYHVNNRKESAQKINIQMVQENQSILKDKILLIPRDYMDKRITKAQMDKYYPFQYMIAGRDTINKAIDSADNRYAVAVVAPDESQSAPNGGLQYVEYAYNIEDGSFLAASGVADMPSDPKNSSSNPAAATKPLITKRTLYDFCMYIRDSDSSDSGAKKKGRK